VSEHGDARGVDGARTRLIIQRQHTGRDTADHGLQKGPLLFDFGLAAVGVVSSSLELRHHFGQALTEIALAHRKRSLSEIVHRTHQRTREAKRDPDRSQNRQGEDQRQCHHKAEFQRLAHERQLLVPLKGRLHFLTELPAPRDAGTEPTARKTEPVAGRQHESALSAAQIELVSVERTQCAAQRGHQFLGFDFRKASADLGRTALNLPDFIADCLPERRSPNKRQALTATIQNTTSVRIASMISR